MLTLRTNQNRTKMYSPPTYTNMYNNNHPTMSYYQQVEQAERQQQSRRMSYCDYLSSSSVSSQGSFSDYENSPLTCHEDYSSYQQKFIGSSFYPIQQQQPFVHSQQPQQQQQPGAAAALFAAYNSHHHYQQVQHHHQFVDYHPTSIMIEPVAAKQEYQPWMMYNNTSPSCSTTTCSPISSPVILSYSTSTIIEEQEDEVKEEPATVTPVKKTSKATTKKMKTARAKRNAAISGVTTAKKQAQEVDENKNFPCHHEDCGKVFRRSEHLKRHVRSIHTREKRKFALFTNK